MDRPKSDTLLLEHRWLAQKEGAIMLERMYDHPDYIERAARVTAVFAFVAALGYLLNALDLLSLTPREAPLASYPWMLAGVYFLIGWMVLTYNRRLWTAVVVINVVLLMIFVAEYKLRGAIDFTAGGVIIKLAQTALEFALLYLILNTGYSTQRRSSNDRTHPTQQS
jgi:hypothetical protein